jgi:hypothetical protein
LFVSLPLSGSIGLDGFLQPKKNVALCAYQTLNHMDVIVNSEKPIRKVTYVRARWNDWHENRAFVFDEGDEVQVIKLTNNDGSDEFRKNGPINRVFYFTLKSENQSNGALLEKYYSSLAKGDISLENATPPAGWQTDQKNRAAVLDQKEISVSGSCDEKCLRLVLIDRQTTDAEALAACHKLI